MTGVALLLGLGIVAIAVLSRAGVASTGPSSTPGPGGSGTSQLVVPTVASPQNLAFGLSIGRQDAPATLTVWEDFQCPICREFTLQVEPRLYTDYVIPGKLRIVYRDFAFIGPESFDAAVAARCAGDQGKFWPYHDYLFWNQGTENGGAFSRRRLDEIADAVGLDRASFDACVGSTRPLADVNADTAGAQAAGIGETPTLVVDNQVMPGAPVSDLQYAALGNVIKASIAAHSTPTPPASSPGSSSTAP